MFSERLHNRGSARASNFISESESDERFRRHLICTHFHDALSTDGGKKLYLGFIAVKSDFGGAALFVGLSAICVMGGACEISQAQPGFEESVVGSPSVVDGDTIDIHGERIRFNGIDAPESSQLCLDEIGSKYRCGAVSANALADFLSTSLPVACTFVDRDRYGRFVGDCYLANGKSVQEWMVSSGHALDWPRYSGGKYATLQAEAKNDHRGVWKGDFQEPWNWRAENKGGHLKKSTSIPVVSGAAVNSSCTIKGNINSKGIRIFHVPGQRDYQKTKISEGKGERWFCSAEEATAAGWRPAAR